MATLLEHGFGFDGAHRNITLALEVRGSEGRTDAIMMPKQQPKHPFSRDCYSYPLVLPQ